jgi:hypothetical protein
MVDLLTVTSLSQLLLILIILFMFFTKPPTLMRWSNVLRLPSQIVFLGQTQFAIMLCYQFTRIKRFIKLSTEGQREPKTTFFMSGIVLKLPYGL